MYVLEKKQLDKDCWHVVKLKTTCHWKKMEKTQKVYKSNIKSLKFKNKFGY